MGRPKDKKRAYWLVYLMGRMMDDLMVQGLVLMWG